MRFTEETIEALNNAIDEKKRQNPISGHTIGIGLNIRNGMKEPTIYKNNWEICELSELNRMIEELEMVRAALAETVGIIV